MRYVIFIFALTLSFGQGGCRSQKYEYALGQKQSPALVHKRTGAMKEEDDRWATLLTQHDWIALNPDGKPLNSCKLVFTQRPNQRLRFYMGHPRSFEVDDHTRALKYVGELEPVGRKGVELDGFILGPAHCGWSQFQINGLDPTNNELHITFHSTCNAHEFPVCLYAFNSHQLRFIPE